MGVNRFTRPQSDRGESNPHFVDGNHEPEPRHVCRSGADPAELTVLQGPEQLRLYVQGQLARLVEESLLDRQPREETLTESEMGRGRVFWTKIVPLEDGSVVVILHEITAQAQLDRVKADLVANVSHELRTPLTAMSALMETLEAKHPGYGFSQHKGYGTDEHRDTVLRLGRCPAHRGMFLRKLMRGRVDPAQMKLFD